MTDRAAVEAFSPSALELDRRLHRRRASRRSVLIALVSTLAFAGVGGWLVVTSPGWDGVRQMFFNLEIAADSFPKILEGLWLNIRVLFFATIAVAVVATLLAVMRSLRGPVWFPLRAIATGYTDLFRGLPVLIVLYLVGFGVPALNPETRIPIAVLGTVGISLCYSAYVAEVLRAGMEAVHPSQRIAARSLGLSHAKTLRMVVIPQALRKVVPALMNDFVSMQKDVGLISVLGAVDAVRAAQIVTAQTYNFTPYVVAGLLFVAMSFPMIRLTDTVSARMARREQQGGTV
ncbi:amino acid ABC transporter permease [Demequina lignilytica]|uniref:Amino acid ABC transporter permease n=1 Tax=Demequina lignilytica TaxID=3051663 RepID=A0AAW7M9K3_9MICO|nr:MULTISPECIES: amino acid ABC transporter permease [unclassified Demequina]MDN4477588.1 amino acid ABC transporter permease [Demequina sp. SYSU T00039-1]MDN4483633.1 amino acid ABC transporter permease [Demequina sp. SYSU T0a273]MDN4488061.1 amino acid ABC transporter permease [Demequina sp. SYSU T00039]MDN4490501.1 amino acid ABC transporter permease [Demequina sp. SYSU T00068]